MEAGYHGEEKLVLHCSLRGGYNEGPLHRQGDSNYGTHCGESEVQRNVKMVEVEFIQQNKYQQW